MSFPSRAYNGAQSSESAVCDCKTKEKGVIVKEEPQDTAGIRNCHFHWVATEYSRQHKSGLLLRSSNVSTRASGPATFVGQQGAFDTISLRDQYRIALCNSDESVLQLFFLKFLLSFSSSNPFIFSLASAGFIPRKCREDVEGGYLPSSRIACRSPAAITIRIARCNPDKKCSRQLFVGEEQMFPFLSGRSELLFARHLGKLLRVVWTRIGARETRQQARADSRVQLRSSQQ